MWNALFYFLEILFYNEQKEAYTVGFHKRDWQRDEPSDNSSYIRNGTSYISLCLQHSKEHGFELVPSDRASDLRLVFPKVNDMAFKVILTKE